MSVYGAGQKKRLCSHKKNGFLSCVCEALTWFYQFINVLWEVQHSFIRFVYIHIMDLYQNVRNKHFCLQFNIPFAYVLVLLLHGPLLLLLTVNRSSSSSLVNILVSSFKLFFSLHFCLIHCVSFSFFRPLDEYEIWEIFKSSAFCFLCFGFSAC